MDLVDNLCCITVKVKCKDGNEEEEGSGTIISDGASFYVMTAGHCITKADKKFFTSDQITIISYAGKEEKHICVLNIVDASSEEDKDYALLSIENPNIDLDFKNQVKRCDDLFDEEKYFFYGYPGSNGEKGRLYKLERRGKGKWHLIDDEINNQTLKPTDLMGGVSGAGLFFRRMNIFYCVGYVKKLVDEDGTYNDIVIYPTSQFDKVLSQTTKETNFFKLVDKWTKMEKESLDRNDKQTYINDHVQYMQNLERKIHILYPDKEEAQDKIDIQLDHYLKGLKLIEEIRKSPNIFNKLNNSEVAAFNRFNNIRSKLFNQAAAARDDLKDVRNTIEEAAKEIFNDEKSKFLINSYADFDIADKLLICSLDYKKKEDD